MPYLIPPTLSDELSAVNVLLGSIAEAPVNSIDNTESSWVASARNILDEISKAVQSEGWAWNREYQMALTPDNTQRISLPDNCLRISKAYPGPHSGELVERARRLYDPRGHTFVFEDAVVVDMIVKLAFEELPESTRRYVTIRAAQQFQGRYQTSQGVDRILDSEVASARVTIEQEEDEVNPQNSISGNAEQVSRLHGRGLRRRS